MSSEKWRPFCANNTIQQYIANNNIYLFVMIYFHKFSSPEFCSASLNNDSQIKIL